MKINLKHSRWLQDGKVEYQAEFPDGAPAGGGSVTVNGVAPDVSGNIVLTASNVDADPSGTALSLVNTETSRATTAEALLAPKADPAFSGRPTVPTAAPGTNDVQAASTAFVRAALDALVNGAPGSLDQLNELAAAMGNDPNFSTTMINSLAGKQPLDDELTALAGLVSAADKLPYFTGAGAASLATFTAFARTILALTDSAGLLALAGAMAATTKLNQIPAPSAAVDLANHELTSVADPTAATSAATKGYVDLRAYVTAPFYVAGALVAGTVGKARFIVPPGNWSIASVQGIIVTASAGSAVTVDVNKNGTTIFTTQANRLSIPAGNTSVQTAAASDVTAVTGGDTISVDIDAVGSSTAGSDLSIQIVLKRA